MSAKTQKIAIKQILVNIFPAYIIEKEKKFSWGNITSQTIFDPDFLAIYNALHNSRGYTAEQFAKPRAINYDFVIDGKKLIIEYDEKQHFTNQRKISLDAYPQDVTLYFDKQRWINECIRIHAKDNYPAYRDEQRAFRDAIRDISAIRNGYTLIRIKDGDYDFTQENGEEILRDIITRAGIII